MATTIKSILGYKIRKEQYFNLFTKPISYDKYHNLQVQHLRKALLDQDIDLANLLIKDGIDVSYLDHNDYIIISKSAYYNYIKNKKNVEFISYLTQLGIYINS
jgi:hypothetical protein